DGNPTLTFPSSNKIPMGTGLAAGDINNDGNLDVALFEGDQIEVFYGDGHRNFPSSAVIPPGGIEDNQNLNPISLADVNGDGRLDLVFPQPPYTGQNGVSAEFQDGSGQFFTDQGGHVFVFTGALGDSLRQVVADFNGDLKPDAVVLPTY